MIVDANQPASAAISKYLCRASYISKCVSTGAQAIQLLHEQQFDMVLLHAELPDIDGIEVLKHYRSYSTQPVIMFSDGDSEPDRVLGLELGADDYLGRFFSFRELQARIDAILRRSLSSARATAPSALKVGTLSLDPSTGRATLANEEIVLTGAEQRILESLMRCAGRLVERSFIGAFALGQTPGPYDRSLDTHISSLRKKLRLHAAETQLKIRSLRGQGYVLTSVSANP